MSWQLSAASVVGTSHVGNGSSCQDSCLAFVENMSDGQPLLAIFVADGAGSALHGGDGSELAVAAAAEFLSTQLAEPLELNTGLAVACVSYVREKIQALADERDLVVRDFAATFLAVLSSPEATLVFQIGDGGIVLDVGDGLDVPVIPMTGEYANMTYFITDEGALDVLATRVYPACARKVAVFSDGLQRLALNLVSNTAHEPFFTPFFSRLATIAPEQEDQFQIGLVNFLNSSSVNERTDDDKTLALAVLVE